MSESIMTFRGKYDFLSNMFTAVFEWDGRTYRNSEAAFQSAKSLDPTVRDTFSEMTGVTAKREGRKVQLRSDWESVKDGIMEDVVREKFVQNPDLLQRLIDTGDMELQEGNNWHDTYWGVDLSSGKGKNRLGTILMKIRSELGGTDYHEKARMIKEEKEKAKQEEETALQAAINEIQEELDRLPVFDFVGKEMRTKAFGRITILSQTDDRLHFQVNGAEKVFSLPDCILRGFLIPDDPSVKETFLHRKELQERQKELKANGISKQDS